VLSALPIAENLQKCDRALCTICKGKEAPYGHSYNDEWFLNSGTSTHFTSFESDFVFMTQGNYGCIETANSKASLFMVAVGTVCKGTPPFLPLNGMTTLWSYLSLFTSDT